MRITALEPMVENLQYAKLEEWLIANHCAADEILPLLPADDVLILFTLLRSTVVILSLSLHMLEDERCFQVMISYWEQVGS